MHGARRALLPVQDRQQGRLTIMWAGWQGDDRHQPALRGGIEPGALKITEFDGACL